MPPAMTFEERLETVLGGRVPDRVPCIPLVYYFAGSFAGVPTREFLTSMKSYRKAMDACFWEVGPWDAMYPLPITMDAPDFEITWGAGLGMRPSLPSGDPGDQGIMQATETEPLMGPDDYSSILGYDFPGKAYPLLRFMVELVARFCGEEPGPGFWVRRFIPHGLRLAGKFGVELERWRIRGVPFFVGFSLEAPFDTFSMARGLTGFSIDLHRRGEEIRDATLKLAESMAYVARLACGITRNRRFLLLTHRSSNDFISPRHFERYAYPSVKYIAEYLASHGIAFGMHMDGNWDRNIEIMTDLPEGTYFQFDGRTDIFRAREILGDGFTLMGDVSANMLAFGSRTEVEDYCRRLIEEIGRNGRFILSSGCEVPSDAKPENVKAMIDSVKRFGRY